MAGWGLPRQECHVCCFCSSYVPEPPTPAQEIPVDTTLHKEELGVVAGLGVNSTQKFQSFL